MPQPHTYTQTLLCLLQYTVVLIHLTTCQLGAAIYPTKHVHTHISAELFIQLLTPLPQVNMFS